MRGETSHTKIQDCCKLRRVVGSGVLEVEGSGMGRLQRGAGEAHKAQKPTCRQGLVERITYFCVFGRIDESSSCKFNFQI